MSRTAQKRSNTRTRSGLVFLGSRLWQSVGWPTDDDARSARAEKMNAEHGRGVLMLTPEGRSIETRGSAGSKRREVDTTSHATGGCKSRGRRALARMRASVGTGE